MQIKITGGKYSNNGMGGISINGKVVDLQVTGSEINNNGLDGISLSIGDDSKVHIDNVSTEENAREGITIKEYNENFQIIESFINSNLSKLTNEDQKMITESLEKCKISTEKNKKVYFKELYDILKNGIVISSLSTLVKNAFEALIK